MGVYNQGMLLPNVVADFLPKTQFGIAQQWYVNRTPLTARLPTAPVGNVEFMMIGYKNRPRTAKLGATVLVGATTLTLTDASYIMNGDVLELSTGEAVEVTDHPNTTANTVAVRRGVGTAQTGQTVVPATAIADITTDPTDADIIILGNSRSGGEVNQLAIQQKPTSRKQFVQSYQHVVSVSGLMQDIQGFPWPGNATPFAKNKMDALQNLMDDIEYSSLYGVGESGGANLYRYKQYGIVNCLSTNKKAATNGNAYKPSDFIADALKPIWSNGGRPSVMFASVSFMTGLAVWGNGLQRLSAGRTAFGVDIDVFYSPFVGDIPIVPNMWLREGSVLTLTADQVRMRFMHEPDYQPYGRRGDTGPASNNGEGDWIARAAIEVNNEAMHSYVTGINTFSPPA